MNEIKDLYDMARGYRMYLVQLGVYFKKVKEGKLYYGIADSFIDFVKSPEIGFNVSEVNTLINIADKFMLLDKDDLPSHHAMKLMASKKVDMDMLDAANSLSVTDFKELLKDKETGTQDRTYRYEIIKRVVETGNIKRVYDDELPTALKELNSSIEHEKRL